AIVADTVAPTITLVDSEKWATTGNAKIKITDKGSGVATYRCEIDDKFCLFEYDAKRNMLSCRLADAPISRNKKHSLTVTVTDNCGNTAITKKTIKW
ncbi:MAG: hypothetical protein IKM10_05415, partial [Bacteroidaceae bacterium]|nr:hypothetical protein [Bacteroidaceae bacterium]